MMRYACLCILMLFTFVLTRNAEAQGQQRMIEILRSDSLSSLSAMDLLMFGETGMTPSPPAGRPSPENTATSLVDNDFFGQLVWWWAVDHRHDADRAVKELAEAWVLRYDSPLPQNLETAWREVLTGLPPIRKTDGTVFQPPAIVPTGPVLWTSRPSFVGWPTLQDPQFLSGISRISTGFPVGRR